MQQHPPEPTEDDLKLRHLIAVAAIIVGVAVAFTQHGQAAIALFTIAGIAIAGYGAYVRRQPDRTPHQLARAREYIWRGMISLAAPNVAYLIAIYAQRILT